MKSLTNDAKKFDISRVMVIALTIIPILLCLIAIIFPESIFAAQEDSLKDQTSKIEGFLTGNILRMTVLVGTVWGAIQAYMAGKFIILASALGIGLGTYGILEWAKTTWAFVI
jgi:fumarate reductase subunit D